MHHIPEPHSIISATDDPGWISGHMPNRVGDFDALGLAARSGDPARPGGVRLPC